MQYGAERKRITTGLKASVSPPFKCPTVYLNLGALSTLGQFAWLIYCACLLDVSGQPHVIVLSLQGLSRKCGRFINSRFLEGAFPSLRIITTTGTPRSPSPAETFAYVAGSEVFSRKLLGRFNLIFARPSRLPGKVDTTVYWDNATRGYYFDVLSEAVHAYAVPGAEVELRGLRSHFSPCERMATLMTSIFDGDRYLDGFVDNVSRLRHYDDYEHFLVRAASPGREHDALLQHVQAWPSCVYINLSEDPGLYGVWNLILCLASGRYLSSANLDDRRSPQHVSMLRRILDQSAADVASSALRITHTPNLRWEDSADSDIWYTAARNPKGRYSWHKLIDDANTRSRNLPHCMPVWRRTLHGAHGLFRENLFGPSADWEFWLRAGMGGAAFYLLSEPLGLYLKAPQSYWSTAAEGKDFDSRILEVYQRNSQQMPLEDRYSGQPLALETVELHYFAHNGAYFGLFHRLLRLAIASTPNGGSEPTFDEVIDRYAARYFGIAAFRKATLDSADYDGADITSTDAAANWALRLLADGVDLGVACVTRNWLWMLAEAFDATNKEKLRAKLASAAGALIMPSV